MSAATQLHAQTNALTNRNGIPPLRPAKPAILPGFWEQHGVAVGLAGLAVVLALVLVWWILSRPKPPVIPAPAEVARQALQPLRQRAEDPGLLAEVSSVLRKYFIAAFELPSEEFTNSELCRHLAGDPRVDPDLSKGIAELLPGMDHRRFRAEVNLSETGLAERALKLIDRAEERLQPAPADAEPATPKP